MIEDFSDVNNNTPVTYGMIGGGEGSFIGDVHRSAIRLDNQAKLVAGSFSRNYDNTKKTGILLGLNKNRLYKDYREMAMGEADRGNKIDFVSIVTPNTFHYDIARSFLKAGINVVCDKPLTCEVAKAKKLVKLAEEKNLLFCVTYTYSGYPMVKHARKMIANGEIGDIRVIMGEYPQEWLAKTVEKEGNKQAAWRTNPRFAGRSNCVGDIGSHIENTVSYMTGLKIKSLAGNLDTFGAGRQLDDNAEIILRYENGASGVYWSSQVAIGYDNGLKIRIFGTKGSLEWEQENPNYLKVSHLNKPTQYLSRGRDELYLPGERLVRIPAGHPEGYFEAFANVYKNFIEAVRDKKEQGHVNSANYDYPTVEDGLQGVKFINRVVDSAENGAVWLDF